MSQDPMVHSCPNPHLIMETLKLLKSKSYIQIQECIFNILKSTNKE